MSPGTAAGAMATIAMACAVRPLRPPPHRQLGLTCQPSAGAAGHRALARWGAAVRRAGRLSASPLPDAALAVVALLTGALIALAPPLGLLGAIAVWVQARLARRRAQRRHQQRIVESLPDAVDLLLLCVAAGLSVPLALPLVAARCPGPLGAALAAADVAASRGRPRADALLDSLLPSGPRAVALAHVLVDHLRYGAPVAPGLERLGLEVRLDRRRRAEEAARRVPVRLLLPLVACVLPAFALLTVVPLLAASLESLPT